MPRQPVKRSLGNIFSAAGATATAKTDIRAVRDLVTSAENTDDPKAMRAEIDAAIKEAGASIKAAHAAYIEAARALIYATARMVDSGAKGVAKESAMAKLYCSEVAQWVANEAVQIHGGYGLMKEFDVERFYRDQRLLQIGEGTSEIQRMVISRAIGC